MHNFVNSKYDGQILEIYIFFKYSAKRQSSLEENIKIYLNIKQIYARHDALRVFIELYQAILVIILYIYEDNTWNSESIITANSLYNSMSNTQCIM